MRIIRTAREMAHFIDSAKDKSVGFVPTMGSLHDGHLSLVRKSLSENGVTIASIFVNPTQFNDSEDFERYPRQYEADQNLLGETGCDVLFLPSVKEIYPQPDQTTYDLGEVAKVLEGRHRPGHFNGVASVVRRLFEIVRPDRAYFGLKDYQQYLVIKALNEKLDLGVEIVGCDIMRDSDGLAMSSRNQLLSRDEKALALHLSETLRKMSEKSRNGLSSAELESWGFNYLSSFPEIEVEYVAVVKSDDLRPVIDDEAEDRRALIAAKVGSVRLIDNIKI